jgi:hypothetical protein
MVKLLLENKANPNIRGKVFRADKSVEDAHQLVSGGRFDTVLQAAAASTEPDGMEIVRLLLDMGLDPNIQGECGLVGTVLVHVYTAPRRRVQDGASRCVVLWKYRCRPTPY